MPFCPSCGAEYMPGHTKCPECEIELVEILPPSQAEEMKFEGKTILLCKTSDVTGSEFLAETFREENIPFVMNPGAVSFRMLPLEYGQKSIRFFVPESALERASEIASRILKDFEDETELDEQDGTDESNEAN
jgi:hypothetical protein